MSRATAVALGLAACVPSTFAAGHILFSNYLTAPYNQVVWSLEVPVVGGTALNSTTVTLQLFYAEGVVTDDALLLGGVSFKVNLDITYDPGLDYDPGRGYGGGGYFYPGASDPDAQYGPQFLPDWQFGDIYTFQLRASGTTPYGLVDSLASRSILWQERNEITLAPVPPPGLPPGTASFVPELIVSVIPEPAALSLFVAGGLALLHRRRTLDPQS